MMIAIRDRVAAETRGRVTNLESIRFEAFRKTLEHIGIRDDDLAAHLNAVYLKHRLEDTELFDDVLPALDALRGRFALGLLSNGNTYPERTGLGGIFQFVVFAQEHGVAKPDPRLFNIAMERAGSSPRQFLHVGDSLSYDVSGANRAGVTSVWLNRDHAANETGIAADHEITSLAQLPDLCERLA
jgi:putative hydrolase of the HAD superfamily